MAIVFTERSLTRSSQMRDYIKTLEEILFNIWNRIPIPTVNLLRMMSTSQTIWRKCEKMELGEASKKFKLFAKPIIAKLSYTK